MKIFHLLTAFNIPQIKKYFLKSTAIMKKFNQKTTNKKIFLYSIIAIINNSI